MSDCALLSVQVVPPWRARGRNEAKNERSHAHLTQWNHVRLNLAYARALTEPSGSNGLTLPDACFVAVIHSLYLYMIAQVGLGLAYLLNTPMSGPGIDNVASSPTSDDVSEARREIEALFRWNPPTLIPPQKKSTIKTRPPAFYDKHFDDRLILRHVTRLPSLVHTLAANVDHMLSAVSKTLPSELSPNMSAERARSRSHISIRAPNEKAVANYYHITTALYCPAIASALVFHPKTAFLSLLNWRQPGSGGYAIMDGQLEIKDEQEVNEADQALFQEILASMSPEVRHAYEKLKGRPLATWEFTSLTTGCDAVMDSVRKLGKFSWAYCEDPKCKKLDKHKNIVKEIAAIEVGCDARKSPWDFNVSSFASNLADDCSLFSRVLFSTVIPILAIPMSRWTRILLPHLFNSREKGKKMHLVSHVGGESASRTMMTKRSKILRS